MPFTHRFAIGKPVASDSQLHEFTDLAILRACNIVRFRGGRSDRFWHQ